MHHLKEWERLRADSACLTCDRKRKKPTLSTAHGSHWLDNVKKESSFSVEHAAETLLIDSAKKKRIKFIKNGLAEQLQKVCSRERSDIAFWKLKKLKEKEKEEAIELRVLSHFVEASLLVAHCSVLSDGQYRDCGCVDVIFNADTHTGLEVGEGAIVTIHPPWQEMVIPPSPFPVLLCTYYYHLSSHQHEPTDISYRRKVLLSPVKMDSTFSTLKRCDALKSRKCVKRAIHFDEMETEETTHTDADASHRSLPTEGFLTTVKAVTHCLSSQQYSSIVEAIESQGGVLATHLNIVGRVQRVYRRSMASRRREATKTSSCARSLRMEIDQERMQEQCWCLLAQDSSAMCFEIILSNFSEDQPAWSQCVESGEGSVYQFSGLRIIRRTNTVRSPSLFSLITSVRSVQQRMAVCPQQSDNKSHSTAESHEGSQVSVQTYCYVLSNTAGRELRMLKCDENEVDVSKFPSYATSPAVESFQLHAGLINHRCSLLGSILYYHTSDSSSIQDDHLFITSHEPPNTGSHIIHISLTTDFKQTNVEAKLLFGNSLVCLRDLLITRRESVVCLVADGFTVVQRVMAASKGQVTSTCVIEDQRWDILMRLQPPVLPQLACDASVNSLVCVTGNISDIDETAAYCWPKCNVCGNDDLEEYNLTGETQGLYCSRCTCHVTNPQVGMDLTVCVTRDDVPDCSVTVQLLQSTIEMLLPESSTQNVEKGYDLHTVQGQHLPPTTCFILSAANQANGCRHFITQQVALRH
ncbi:DNA repair-scaffolding protein-like isoform X2 [Corticium candelabrum]|uniref:DNA repair-scaffolding protein-like isoform X2 n=1 Tax=Corticium candelabrum TaxID=121492 RepID=UPI002E2757F0|nr:DNA repair-scaffolding protein-like isoform X2 [Corticium candelabrum]